MSPACRLPALLIATTAIAPLPAQIEWLPTRSLPTEASMVLDEARECIVLAGDAIPREREFVTWEWDHGDWRDCSRAGSSQPWMTSRLVYDRAGQRVLRVASQTSGTQVIETWQYDSLTWTRLQPLAQPAPRQFFALAYDAARQRTVLFGGFGPGYQRMNDTWEFDGTTWTQRSTPIAPPGRFGSAMAYDEARQEIVLFGGLDQGLARLGDTWLLDGSGWRQAAPSTSPPGRAEHAVAFDRGSQRVVLFGGFGSGSSSLPNTWEWDGSDWTQATPAQSPPPRNQAAMATDPEGGVFLYGGYYQRSDLWRYVNGNWYRYHDHRMVREQAGHQQLVYDGARQRLLWLGDGIGSAMETWEYDGRYWRDASPAGLRPASRYEMGVAFDPARAATVIFGGARSLAAIDETWTWDGAAWNQATPSVRPTARIRHAMAFDPASQCVLLFGGVDGVFSSANLLGDTWLFDGQSWQPLAPTISPSPRSYPAMATDPVRGRVVLFGGYEGMTTNTASDETWAFAGSTWTRLLPVASPPATAQGPLAFDTRRDRMILQGRSGSNLTVTWEFDGTAWSSVAVAPLDRSGPLVYDPRTDQLLLKGGFNAFFEHELFELVRDPRASGASYGQGCSAAGPPPRLSASSVPYFGNHAFQVEVHGTPNAIDLLVLGLSPGAVPIPGCTLLVDPPLGTRAAVANVHGFAAFSQLVPIVPHLRGRHLYYQAAQLDLSTGVVSFTAGLDFVLGS